VAGFDTLRGDDTTSIERTESMITTKMVQSRATMLGRRLGCRVVAVQRGSKENGVSWHVTLYRTDATESPVTTVRLGMTASESYDRLAAMLEGVELAQHYGVAA
jgi:hypothetical protein